MKKLEVSLLVLVCLLIVALGLHSLVQKPQVVRYEVPNLGPRLGSVSFPSLSKIGNNASSTVTSSVGLILSSRLDVQFRLCYNDGTADMWISPTTTALSVQSGFLFRASSSLELYGDKLWPGNLYGVTRAGTTSTFECTQF